MSASDNKDPTSEMRDALAAPAAMYDLSLNRSAAMHDARSNQLRRSAARAAAIHGAASAGAKELAVRAASQAALSQGFKLDAQQAQVPDAAPVPGAFVIHGRTVTSDGSGVAGLTVAADDAASTYACTDDTGYFRLEIAALPLESVAASKVAAAQPATDAETKDAANKDAANADFRPTSRAVRLHVLEKGAELFRDDSAMTAVANTVLYREIVVKPGTGHACDAPPKDRAPAEPA